MTNAYLDYFASLVKHETDLWNLVEARLADAGATTLGRLKALRVIEESPACRVQDLADGLGITVGAASRLTDRLQADGFVSRAPNPDDRRGSLIALLPAGQKAIADTEPLVQQALEAALASVDRATLVSVTETINRFNAVALG
jgi:DNA-binding MarR family transcriptional regulator